MSTFLHSFVFDSDSLPVFSAQDFEDILEGDWGFDTSYEENGVWSSIRQLDGNTYNYNLKTYDDDLNPQDFAVGFSFYGAPPKGVDPYRFRHEDLPIDAILLRVHVGGELMDEYLFPLNPKDSIDSRLKKLLKVIDTVIHRRYTPKSALSFIAKHFPELEMDVDALVSIIDSTLSDLASD